MLDKRTTIEDLLEKGDQSNRSDFDHEEPREIRVPETEVIKHHEQETQTLTNKSQKQEDESLVAVSSQTQTTRASLTKSEQLKKIESVLQEDLEDVFTKLDEKHQMLFKEAGEETAKQIESLLNNVKTKVQRVFELIKSWLSLVPGISKWFVIQEAKIKADKIVKLKQNNRDT